MVARRFSVQELLLAVLLALVVCSSFSSAAKCTYKKKASNTPVVTPATEDTGGSAVEEAAPMTEAPTETGDVSQFTTPAPETESSSFGQGSSFPTQASGESSSTAQTEGSSTAQTEGSSGDVTQTDSNSTSAGDHASFGKVTSSGKCVKGDPTTYVTREDVDWVWKNTMESYVPPFKNLIFDQLVTNKGKLTYCVRWDNNKKLTKAVASKFEAMLEKQMNLWNRWLVGYECWPINKIEISIVGYAVRDKSIMDWSDDSLGTIYEGILDDEGSPKCPDECYKHQGQAASADTSGCKGKPFDMSLWPSTKPGEGAIGTGGDWGQRVEVNDMLATMDQSDMMVLLHEMGHGFGLPEMYVDKNKPAGYPSCVMDNDLKLTDGDGWLLRSVLENIKTRYSFGK
ncbi:neutral zinc metallopeptidase [Phytophthora sojae]|uniref:Neutral zinc metallopeptidase n=1 Tax=Phytophthora sojae (strain P6497) TaxID=1094619 RepID=G4YRW5_PHYSP|nr:neutral zinc metallopeptidase [Phytophthora sojae]EGZ22942.1 neutral zinc metallopeptidase [Phytophthora sojae]|eukprot:XP_009518230.1 neutral zinc metallopeptidase [Phytophthora sojae]